MHQPVRRQHYRDVIERIENTNLTNQPVTDTLLLVLSNNYSRRKITWPLGSRGVRPAARRGLDLCICLMTSPGGGRSLKHRRVLEPLCWTTEGGLSPTAQSQSCRIAFPFSPANEAGCFFKTGNLLSEG